MNADNSSEKDETDASYEEQDNASTPASSSDSNAHRANPQHESGSGSGSGSSTSGNGSGGPGEHQPDHDRDEDPGDADKINPFTPKQEPKVEEVAWNVRKFVRLPANTVSTVGGTVYGYAMDRLAELLRFVPAPVLVALISTVSTISGTRYNAHRNKLASHAAEQKAARQKRAEIERILRKTYMELAAPLLKSASKLADRIYFLVDSDWERIEKPQVEPHISPAYSAYLLGRYFAMVEILKQESALLDYGFHASDRVLANILGRVQGVFAANDQLLLELQKTERLFHPHDGERVILGGPLRVTPRAQAVLGELMFRRLYSKTVDFVDKAENEKRGSRAVITFREFSSLLEKDATIARWYKPVIRDFATLENLLQRIPRSKRRCDPIGSRLYFVQSALMDLVEFFDPLPRAQSVPFYRRRRLQLGGASIAEEQRAPLSLRLLYKELAIIRDHRVMEGRTMDRLKLPNGAVEVYVKASQADSGGDLNSLKQGDCPYSHRVLILLEELGVPYSSVAIAPMAKPGWFYLLHPEKRTPVVYHNGNLVEDSRHIMTYVTQTFRPAKGKAPLSSASNIALPMGTSAYTRFHGEFVKWLSGEECARSKLEDELRRVNGTIAYAQRVNEKGSFLGGCRFAREDTAIAPMLHNVVVAGQALKNWELPEDCKAIRKYVEDARKVPSFAKTVGENKAIVAGYGCLAKKGGEKVWALADMLE